MKPLRLAVCCLNISEGRNQQIIQNIADSAVLKQDVWVPDDKQCSNTDIKCKATVLSVYSDAVFNRANITIAAPVEYLSTSVYQACASAFELLNLRNHIDPGHPRLGVVDLVPVHPISNSVSVTTCGRIAICISDKLMKNVSGASIFLFGAADKLNRGLIQRRKEMNWFAGKSDVNCRPDMGDLNADCGITAIGAIPFMSVLNILLDTDELSIGQDIASIVRGKNPTTGLAGIQAMAFQKRGKVEIACNIDTNDLQSELPVFKTTFEELESTMRLLAAERNTNVIGQSLRGFSPYEAYSLASHALRIGDITPWKQQKALIM